MGYCKDAHNLVLFIDTVDYPIFTTGDTVTSQMTRTHLPATVRARGNLEFFDGLSNLLVGVRGTLADLFQHLLEIVLSVTDSDLKHCFSFIL